MLTVESGVARIELPQLRRLLIFFISNLSDIECIKEDVIESSGSCGRLTQFLIIARVRAAVPACMAQHLLGATLIRDSTKDPRRRISNSGKCVGVVAEYTRVLIHRYVYLSRCLRRAGSDFTGCPVVTVIAACEA